VAGADARVAALRALPGRGPLAPAAGPGYAARALQEYVQALTGSPAAAAQRALLDRIVARPRAHARLVNTFARMEYVGVRKILKSRRAEALDLDGLQHILDETVHALRLKKAALALAGAAPGGPVPVATFSADDTLAGDVGEAYLQGVDRAAEVALADLPEATRVEVNYVLSSAAIEVRAQAFYPLYEACLRAHDVPMSVAAIVRDEDRHLGDMAAALARALPDWRARLERVLVTEQALFDRFFAAVAQAVATPDEVTAGAA
jgi:hypothetical protein